MADIDHPEQPLDGCCFHCGEPLHLMSVYTTGKSTLWLHPECADAMALQLIKDAGRAVAFKERHFPRVSDIGRSDLSRKMRRSK